MAKKGCGPLGCRNKQMFYKNMGLYPSGYDPDAQAWFDTWLVDAGVVYRDAWNAFVVGCKADLNTTQTGSNWDEFIRLWNWTTMQQQHSRVCTKSLLSLTERGAIIWTQKTSYASDGTSWLDTNFIPSADGGVKFTLNEASAGILIKSNTQSAGYDFAATGNGANNGAVALSARSNTDLFLGRMNSNNLLSNTVANNNSIGWHCLYRNDANTIEFIQNGISLGTSARISASMPNVAIYVCCRNANGVAQAFITRPYGAFFIGSKLVDSLALTNRWNAFETAIAGL